MDAAGELRAALDACAVVNRSGLARVRATGPDLLGLLHRLSTKAVKDLAPGQGRSTVLTTNKGRIVARLFVHHLGEPGVLLCGGAGDAGRIIAHLDKYTFAEQTGFEDASASWCQVALVGPRAHDALRESGLPPVEPGQTASGSLGDLAVHVLGQDGDSEHGVSVVAASEDFAPVWSALVEAAEAHGGRPLGAQAAEARRVLLGLPAAGRELTEEHNPLEAGLWGAVDFDKGCYVGQEVVARLNTYDKVSRVLRGFVLEPGDPVPEPGTRLLAGERRVGVLTSALVPPGRRAPVALGYVKRDHADPGTELRPDRPGAAPLRVHALPLADTP
jgi:folate-binding protein YgfZ